MNELSRFGVPGGFRCFESQDELIAGVMNIGNDFSLFFKDSIPM
jgi:hypothetical protein